MKKIFGTIIAFMLLGIYVYFIWIGLDIINCQVKHSCNPAASVQFNDSMAQALTVIQGLISALVISVLAKAEPQDSIISPLVESEMKLSAMMRNALKCMTWLYLITWVVMGFWVFLKGLYYPKAVPALTNLGQAWFGIAIASAYSYFGLRQASSATKKPIVT